MIERKTFNTIEMNRRDKVIIQHSFHIEGDIEIDWGKAICIKYNDVAKPQWIPKSAIKILSKTILPPTDYHRERAVYIVDVAEWYKEKNRWYYRESRNPATVGTISKNQ